MKEKSDTPEIILKRKTRIISITYAIRLAVAIFPRVARRADLGDGLLGNARQRKRWMERQSTRNAKDEGAHARGSPGSV